MEQSIKYFNGIIQSLFSNTKDPIKQTKLYSTPEEKRFNQNDYRTFLELLDLIIYQQDYIVEAKALLASCEQTLEHIIAQIDGEHDRYFIRAKEEEESRIRDIKLFLSAVTEEDELLLREWFRSNRPFPCFDGPRGFSRVLYRSGVNEDLLEQLHKPKLKLIAQIKANSQRVYVNSKKKFEEVSIKYIHKKLFTKGFCILVLEDVLYVFFLIDQDFSVAKRLVMFNTKRLVVDIQTLDFNEVFTSLETNIQLDILLDSLSDLYRSSDYQFGFPVELHTKP